ncbi:MAG: enoyl-CoA hydratase/isomerase family protein [Alphaproteobacteria bacterium]|nr:enoyl-CoA hydratase/isomerase family protein [Alphaproteobacteria bacterium]
MSADQAKKPPYQPVTGDLKMTKSGGIATIVIDRPDDDNRLTPDALAKLEVLARELARDDETNVLVVTGAGSKFFSMGILNPVIRASYSKEDVIEIVRLANRAYAAVEALPQITIAALNGVTRAGGAELSLACDIRIAAAHATMALPEASWGSFPGAGAPYRLASIVGKARALELICTSRSVDSAEMERLGLVQHVYPSERLAAEVRALAERIASAGPLATRGAKRIMAARLDPGLPAARELSDALRYAIEWSDDVDEGIAAHREGRKPRFTGR